MVVGRGGGVHFKNSYFQGGEGGGVQFSYVIICGVKF